MVVIFVALLLIGLIFLPQLWVRYSIARYAYHREDYPGTGGELARHLLDQANLKDIPVEISKTGDHYDPIDKAVRLSDAHLNGRSLSAVAIAAHEVGHAIQDAQDYLPMKWRTRYAPHVSLIERVGVVLMLATPFVGALTRAPSLILLEILVGITVLSSRIFFHLLTLPVEIDASFGRALPLLKAGNYLDSRDMPAVSQVLKAAAFTYVSAALVSLLDISRWIRLLR